MGTIQKLSSQVIDYAERVSDMADAAQGKHHQRAGLTSRWLLLPASGAALYALVKSDALARPAKGHGRGEGTGFRAPRRSSEHGAPEHERHLGPERERDKLIQLDCSEVDPAFELEQAPRHAQGEFDTEDDGVRTLTWLSCSRRDAEDG